MPQKIDTLFYELEARTAGFERDLLAAETKIKSFTDFASKNYGLMAGAIGVALAGVAAASVRLAVEFDQQMTKVATVANTTREGLQTLGDGVQQLFRELPVKDVSELSEALYQILSSGIDAGRGLEVLRVAARAAVGGFTDVATVADALTSVMNAYADSGLTAAHAADVMAKAVANGKIEFADIAQSIGSVTGIAASFGTSIEDVAAVLTQLSLKGIKTAEGVTGLRSALINVLRPAEGFREEFPKLAAEFTKSRLERDGFVKFLLDFQRESGGSATALASLFRDTQAYTAVVTLLKDEGAGLTKQQQEMAKSAGSFDKAAETAEKSASALWQTLKNNLSSALTEIGRFLLPLVVQGLDGLNRIVERFNGTAARASAKNDLATVLRDSAAAARAVTTAGQAFKPTRDAAVSLADAVKEGTLNLRALSSADLSKLNGGLIELAKNPLLTGKQRATFVDLARQAAAAADEVRAAEAKANAEAKKAAEFAKARQEQLKKDEAAQHARENAKAQGELAEKAQATARAMRDVTQGFADLAERAGSGELTVTAFDRALRELGDRFNDVKGKTKAQRDQFAQLSASAGVVRQALLDIRAAKTAREFEELRASLTPSAVDDFTVRLKALHDELSKREFTDAQIAVIRSLIEAQRDAAQSTEALDAELVKIHDTSISTFDEQVQLVGVVQRLEAALKSAKSANDGTAESQIKIAALQQQLANAQARLAQLTGDTSAATHATKSATEQWLSALTAAGQVAFGLASTLLGSENTLTRMIGATVQIAGGFSDIAALATKAGGLGALFSTGGGIASALPGIGAIIGGVASVASLLGGKKETAEEKRARELMAENNRRLADLRDGLAEVVRAGIGGEKQAAIRDLVFTKDVSGGIDNTTGEQTMVSVTKSSRELLDELRAMGVGLDDLKKAAAAFGVTLSAMPTADELATLSQFIRVNSLRKLTDTLSGQLQLLELKAKFDPDAFGGINGLLERIKLLTQEGKNGIPALRDALKGLNLETAQGRADAIVALKALFGELGTLDLSKFGAVDPGEFADMLAELIASLQNAQPKAKTAGEKFSEALELIGLRVDLAGLTAAKRLEAVRDALQSAFGDIVNGLDLSSVDALQSSIGAIIETLTADGELTDEEKAMAAALRELLDAYKAAQDAAVKYSDALSVLGDQFEIFGATAVEEFAGVGAELAKQFPDIATLLDGLDVTTGEGRAQLRERAKALFRQLQEGGVTEEEQAIVDAIKRMLGLANAVANDEAKQADALAKEREAKRRAVLQAAEDDIRRRDVTDPAQQLQRRLQAVLEIFPSLTNALGEFDVSTQAGRDALEAWINQMFDSPGQLDALAESMGVTVDELVSALLNLEDNADGAREQVQSLADALGAAFAENDYALQLEGVVDPLERLKRTAAAASGVLPQLSDALANLDLSTEEGRKKAEANLVALGKSTTDATVRRAILDVLDQLRAIAPAAIAPAASTPSDPLGDIRRTADQALQSASATALAYNPQFSVLLDLERQQVTLLTGILAALSGRVVPLPPALPASSTSGAGGVSVSFPINFFGSVTVSDPAELARGIQPLLLSTAETALGTNLKVSRLLKGSGAIG